MNIDLKEIEISIKTIFIPDYKINKQDLQKNLSKNEAEIQELETLKSEIKFCILCEDLEHIPFLKEFYKEDLKKIEKLIFTSKNVPLPMKEDFISTINYLKSSSKDIKILDINETNKYEKFAAACILKAEKLASEIYIILSQDINLEVVINCFLIAFHFDNKALALALYNIIREFILLWNGIINDPEIQEVKKLLNTLDKYRLESKENIISLISQFYILSFDSVIFKNLMFLQTKEKENLLKPLFQYLSYNINRKKENKRIGQDFEEDTYPHIFTMVRENDKKCMALAWQGDAHGSILMFIEGTQAFSCYNSFFLGIIERNYWGTKFEIYDYGLDEILLSKIPQFLLPLRRKIGEINYQTNILGEVPRDFSLILYDFNEKKNTKIVSVKPEYNEKKDCYQLNFYGRAKKASARNFHLISPDDPDSILFLHGKVSKNSFNIDYRHPFNIVQAFATSLVSISKKFLVS